MPDPADPQTDTPGVPAGSDTPGVPAGSDTPGVPAGSDTPGVPAGSDTPDGAAGVAPPEPPAAPRTRRRSTAAAAGTPSADVPADADGPGSAPAPDAVPTSDLDPAPADAPAPTPRKRAPRKAVKAVKTAKSRKVGQPEPAVTPAGGPSDGPLPEETGSAAPPAVTDSAAGREAGTAPDLSRAQIAPADLPVAQALADAEPRIEAVEDDDIVAQAALDDARAPLPPPAGAEPAGAEPADESAGTSPAGAEPADESAHRAPAAVPFQAPEPAAVPFQAPPPAAVDTEVPAEPLPPRRRRRAGTAGAVSAAALVPTLLEPVPTSDGADEPVDEPETEQVDSEHPYDDDEAGSRPRRRRRGRRGRGRRPDGEIDDDGDLDGPAAARTPAHGPAGDIDGDTDGDTDGDIDGDTDGTEDGDGEGDDGPAGTTGTRRRRRRRRRGGSADDGDDEPGVVVHVREGRTRVRGAGAADEDGVRGITGSTRMAAKRVRRQEGRDSGRRRQPIVSEAEFLARRESVDRVMVVRQTGDRTQIAVLEDGVLVEHYVTRTSAQSFAGNVYLGRVQNVLPSMEAAFVDIGKGRNAVLYAGEVNWADIGGGQRKIESALKSGQEVLVQVSKDPIGHKGARLTGQISLPGRYLVYVPEGSMTGISRKLPDTERDRLKAILKKVVPDDAGVIIRTAAEGASEEEIAADVRRLQAQWEVISTKAAQGGAPKLLHAEPDLVIRVIRDVFNEDFASLVVQGDSEWETIRDYVEFVAPDLADRLSRHTAETDVFAEHRIDEQLAKALDRKVWLPSGGSLVIDRTEAMVVIDVNTGKYTGQGGNLEETVTRNNLEAAEEIARQLRLRDLGGIIVVDFIDMVLESNRDLVVRRLAECMARDRTKHQVAEVTSLGLVQMTRKRVGQGLLESFSEPCDHCGGRGVLVSTEPLDAPRGGADGDRRGRGRRAERKTEPRGDSDRDDVRSAAGRKAPADADRPPAAAAPDQDQTAGERSAGRRRRRGRGGAAVAPSEELAELMADTPPDLADQPASDQEDLPVLPAATQYAPGEQPVAEGDAPPRRRRRATSRPAGPPVAP